jgi:hypothetical protein
MNGASVFVSLVYNVAHVAVLVVWVIIPGLLLYQSYLALDLAFRKQTKKLSRSPARGRSPARTTSPARVKAE